MPNFEKDAERERRISDEAIVDAYGPEEQALGWYYYLQEKIAFPFMARCIKETKSSPLEKGETVEVIEQAPEEDCMCTMMVIIKWHGREMGIKLESIEAIDPDEDTEEGIGDWHYWVNRGYRTC